MRILFAEAAKDELNDACGWYERQQSGLGDRFKSDVRDAALFIAKSPFLFPVEVEDVRRFVMPRFPYTLRYTLRSEEVWILAVSHQHRHPDYWVERVKDQ
ncbi:type II toxin-antitoxin system RelE/ParE family toxin [Sideroxydans sp.]